MAKHNESKFKIRENCIEEMIKKKKIKTIIILNL